MKYFLKNILLDIWQLFVSQFPGPTGYKLRYSFWKKRLKYIGTGVKIDVGVYFQNPQFISIDNNCWIDRSVIILAGPDKSERLRRYISNPNFTIKKGEVYLGKNIHIAPFSIISGIGGVHLSDDCGIGSGSKIYSFSHHYRSDINRSDKSINFGPLVEHKRQFMIEGPIFLGENVGIASNSMILPGVSIQKNSFVMLNSVVASSFGENSLISGNPANCLKKRFNENK